MNRLTDKKQLFADALADASPAGFRESLLGQTLRQVRRRRQFRQMRRTGLALAILALLAVWFRPRPTSHRANTVAVSSPGYQLIETQPLPASALVETKPFTGQIVASVATAKVVTTAEAGDRPRELTDDELLALAPAPAALIRLGPHSAELVLANQSETHVQ